MKRSKKLICSLCVAVAVAGIAHVPSGMCESNIAYAHSGRTDANGGHHDNRNKSGLGSYHYHCGGHPAHLHENGVCPYSSQSSASSSSGSSNSGYSKTLVKKVQSKLNHLGYDCGTADGVYGSKTKKALKKFQKDHGLECDGKIGKEVKNALEIN